jgi:hypothetical protein
LASAKPLGAGQGWPSVPVGKDGKKGSSRKYNSLVPALDKFYRLNIC